MRILLQCSIILLQCSIARAFTTGVSGFSGKDGSTCTNCHSGGVLPKATLSGPSSLEAGAMGTYTLLIDTDVNSSASAMRAAGLDVAASAGTLGTVPQLNQTRILNGELSHTTALPKSKLVQVMFTLTAPATAQTVTLFAAALSTDGNGATSGDGTDATTLNVQVNAPPPPPPDLAGGDFAGVDLAGEDLAQPPPPDLSAPPPDLLVVDAVSSATMVQRPAPQPDLGPPKNEARWNCGSIIPSGGGGGPIAGLVPLILVTGAVMIARRRRR